MGIELKVVVVTKILKHLAKTGAFHVLYIIPTHLNQRVRSVQQGIKLEAKTTRAIYAVASIESAFALRLSVQQDNRKCHQRKGRERNSYHSESEGLI